MGSAFTYVNEITAQAAAVSGVEINAWITVGSPNAATVGWSAWFETMSAWEAATDKLAADTLYNEAIEGGDSLFTGSVTDRLINVITPLSIDAPPTYVGTVNAVAAAGHFGDAINHGLEIAAAATEISGLNTLFGIGSTGPYGGIGWLTGAPDIAAFEAGQNKINADPKFLELVDSGGKFYAPGAEQTLYRRLV